MPSPPPVRPRIRLWMKLAAFAVLGVVATHAVHLILANWMTRDALERQGETLGRSAARLVARQAADAILVDDPATLSEIVSSAVAGGDIAYCFILRDERVVATSFRGATPPALVAARRGRPTEAAFVVVDGRGRYLDVAEPILDGSADVVRVGMDLEIIGATRRRLALLLGVVAVLMILAGCAAALIVGRGIARPIDDLVAAADALDVSLATRAVPATGNDEIAVLTDRFNRMVARLKAAHDEQERGRHKQVTTERMAALGQLVAGVAHEINNPLAGMKNCLRRLQRGDLGAAELRDEYLELMEEGLERIEDVVRHLLDFGRPRALEPREIAARALVQEARLLLQPMLRKRRITLVEPAGDDRVVADAQQAGQALLNLLLNAAYVTPDGGRIRVALRRRPGGCGLSVQDDGPGIPEAIRDRICEPFFSTKPEGEGTGLGLSVTRAIAEAHGGELAFECPPEGGTIATLWLRAPGAPTTPAPRRP